MDPYQDYVCTAAAVSITNQPSRHLRIVGAATIQRLIPCQLTNKSLRLSTPFKNRFTTQELLLRNRENLIIPTLQCKEENLDIEKVPLKYNVFIKIIKTKSLQSYKHVT